nr:hypothetical protein CFP56_07626 [Quercus suber]
MSSGCRCHGNQTRIPVTQKELQHLPGIQRQPSGSGLLQVMMGVQQSNGRRCHRVDTIARTTLHAEGVPWHNIATYCYQRQQRISLNEAVIASPGFCQSTRCVYLARIAIGAANKDWDCQTIAIMGTQTAPEVEQDLCILFDLTSMLNDRNLCCICWSWSEIHVD